MVVCWNGRRKEGADDILETICVIFITPGNLSPHLITCQLSPRLNHCIVLRHRWIAMFFSCLSFGEVYFVCINLNYCELNHLFLTFDLQNFTIIEVDWVIYSPKWILKKDFSFFFYFYYKSLLFPSLASQV